MWWASIPAYIAAVIRELWGLLIGGVAAVIGVIALSVSGVTVAWWEWIIMGLVCLTPAQYLAFHRLRQQGQQQPAPAQPQVITNITNSYTTYVLGGEAIPPETPPQLEPGGEVEE